MPLPLRPAATFCRRTASAVTVLIATFGALPDLALAADSSDPTIKSFDVPPGDASVTIKEFARQARRAIMYPSEPLTGVQTNAVKGDFEPRAALQRMLSGTGFVAIEDAKTGALAIKPVNDPNPAPTPAETSSPASSTPDPATRVVKLDPFVVQTGADRGYGALNANSITGFNAALNKLPLTADIFDQQFMSDIGDSSIEDMITNYSAGAGVNYGSASSASSSNQPGDRNGSAILELRGLNAPTTMINSFLPMTTQVTTSSTTTNYTSNFSFERAEIIKGPQALLYGFGGAGGVFNMVTKQAHFDEPSHGSEMFQVDQYGNKLDQLDYSFGTDDVGFRLALVDQAIGYRRLYIGGPMHGFYLQGLVKLGGKTTVRGDITRTDVPNFVFPVQLSLVAASTANDARNGSNLEYLLATNQIGAAANGGASGAGSIDNGQVNWNNAYSYTGAFGNQHGNDTFETVSVDSKWSDWFSTQLQAAYRFFPLGRGEYGGSLYAPNASTNPFPGQWAAGFTGSNGPVDSDEGIRAKALRFGALLTNDLFGGSAHSQTNVGGDYNRVNNTLVDYSYYEADSNWNVLYNSSSTSNIGRTALAPYYWTVTNGPVKYPGWSNLSPRITINGQNYVRMESDYSVASLVSLPNNPLGVVQIGNGRTHRENETINRGVYAINYTTWDDSKLTTMAGFRLAGDYGSLIGQNPSYYEYDNNTLNFDFGADYALFPWLRPYFEISDAYDPPPNLGGNPYGAPAQIAHEFGEEVGVKIQNKDGTLSGSIALYSTQSKNEVLNASASVTNDINPSGLNGTYLVPSNGFNTNRATDGVEVTFTALPTPNWRIRLSAAMANGTTETGTNYPQLYNDQFYENSAGDVTYADGAIVYVNPTYNSKQLTVASSTTGAIPLTVLAMSTPGNVYYANPQPINGQILSSTAVAAVLHSTDPVHGSILTGKTGLPISALQINPALSGVAIPGSIQASNAGDPTYSYPEYSVNLVSVYTIAQGPFKGFKIGETARLGWKNRQFLYYPNGYLLDAPDKLFYFPTTAVFGGIFGYERRFGRYLFSTQLNVSNIFNNYQVIVVPNSVTGYSGAPSTLNATFNNQPRQYLWTNTISF